MEVRSMLGLLGLVLMLAIIPDGVAAVDAVARLLVLVLVWNWTTHADKLRGSPTGGCNCQENDDPSPS